MAGRGRPLEPARAVVVLGGGAPLRAMEAAKLYNQGWAHEVWLTPTSLFSEDSGLAQPGIERTPEHVYSRMVLERLGVPGTAIRVLSGTNYITADEVRTVARELTRYGGDRVILVTSSYHTRRVKILWHALVGKYPEAVVRYTPDDLGRRSAGDVWASVRRRDSVSEGEGYLARRREGRHPHQR